MTTATALEFKNNLGKYIDLAQKSPVLVTRHSRPSVWVIRADDAEDMIDLYEAKNIDMNANYIGTDATRSLFTRIKNA
jgi:prevent-host-death family protein